MLRSRPTRPVSPLTSKRRGPVSLSRSAQRGTAGVHRSDGFASEFRLPATDTPTLAISRFPAHFIPQERALCQVKEKEQRRVNHGVDWVKDRGLPQQKEVSGSFRARPLDSAGVRDGRAGDRRVSAAALGRVLRVEMGVGDALRSCPVPEHFSTNSLWTPSAPC